MHRLLALLSLSACTAPSTPSGASTPTSPTVPPAERPALRDLDFFQAVQVPALANGVEIPSTERVAPVIVGRDVVLRARLDVPSGWEGGEVEVFVDLTHDGTPETRSVVGDPNTDLVVSIPASAIAEDATYVVRVVAAGAEQHRFPDQGEAELGAIVTGPLKLLLMPFEVDGFVPDTSAAVVEGYRAALVATYPVTDVEITVAAVEVWAAPFDLGDINVRVGELQETAMYDGELDWDVYAYGMVSGFASREAFEGVTGTSESGGDEPLTRAYFAAGAAFGDQKSEDTLIHEIGHTHRLLHTACDGESDPDPGYPYAGGSIGVEGYDERTGAFVQPDVAYDLMSYCFPRWVSDYSYARLATHVANAQTYSGPQ